MVTAKKSKKNRAFDSQYILKIYFSLLKNYKALFFLILVVVLLTEATIVVDKFLFKTIIDYGNDYAIEKIQQPLFIKILFIVALIYAALIITRFSLKWLEIHLLNIIDGGLITDLKRKFFNHIVTLSYKFHTTHKTGSLISRLVRGGRAIESMTDVIIFNFAPLFFQIIIVSSSLLYFTWQPAVIVLIISVLFLVYSYLIQEAQKSYNYAANEAEDREKGHISDYFTNIESIKYFGKELVIIQKFRKITEETKNAFIKHWNYYRWLDAGQIIILSVGTFFVIYFPLVDFINHKLSLGTLVFIYTVYGTLVPNLFSFVRGIRDYYRTMADFESLFQYYKIKNEIKDQSKAETLQIKEATIEFRNVSFSYQNRKLFQNFNLIIPKNKKIALVGHSGSGKTTLIKLLYRFYDLQKGEILIDGKNIKEVKQESLRSELSIVPQECVLFDDTIYNNILFSNPNTSKKDIQEAIVSAQLEQVIKNFPQKEKTIVGERGVKLSGGEKQRVSIARALLADKKILILDEATSALDSKTEHEIQQALENLMHNRTSIIIAHRLSTIMKADQIIVLEKGRIVQMGTHQELIKKRGTYKKLWALQKGGYIR